MSRQKKKKKTVKRQKTKKLWGLEPRTFSRGSRYLVDQDYHKELSQKDKEWLSVFNEEYYSNKLTKKTKRSKAKRKVIYDLTNARNRDIQTRFYKINETIKNVKTENQNWDNIFDVIRRLDYNIIEDANIEYLDYKRAIEKYINQGMNIEDARNAAFMELYTK
jgi:hypothetical protein